MPKTVVQRLANPLTSSAGIRYYSDYAARLLADKPLKDRLWEQWQSFEAEGFVIWYRPASAEGRVEVSFKMPADIGNISARYRIEIFIPGQHARALARYTIIVPDEQHNLVEKTAYIDQGYYANEWAALGDFFIDAGSPDRSEMMGMVRLVDLAPIKDTPPDVCFGPVRWVPQYQTPEPLTTLVNSPQFALAYEGLPPDAQPQGWWVQKENGAVEQPPLNQRWKVWGPARWLQRARLDSDPQEAVRAEYRLPAATPPGRYRVEALIPFFDRKSLAPEAHYQVRFGPLPGDVRETRVDQTVGRVNQWVSLGEYDFAFDPLHASDSLGVVTQIAARSRSYITAFGPVRWVPLFELAFQPGEAFDFPVGSQAQRKAPIIKRGVSANGTSFWLDDWLDATPFLTEYGLGLHTGADLNYARGSGLHLPVYAAADGVITYAQQVQRGSWNYIIVIEHPTAFVNVDGRREQRKVYTRYGHVHKDSLALEGVRVGLPVRGGQQIGFVGYMCANDQEERKDGEHLHFDVSHTAILKENPEYWPAMSDLARMFRAGQTATQEYKKLKKATEALVQRDFLDPLQFTIDNHTRTADASTPAAPADNGLFSPESPRFDFPVGAAEQRAMPISLRIDQMGEGIFATGVEDWYLTSAFLATAPDGTPLPGVILRLPNGLAGGQKVFSPGPGLVIFAGRVNLGPFGSQNVVVTRHTNAVVCRQPGSPGLQTVYTRLGGLAALQIHAGEVVQAGQPVGVQAGQPVGVLGGNMLSGPPDWRLHIAVSDTAVLEDPAHWPGAEDLRAMLRKRRPAQEPERSRYDTALKTARLAAQAEVQQDYLNPIQFCIDNHPSAPQLQNWRAGAAA